MADYYPLISRAVAGLEKSSGESRRALYERARKALVDQLRSVTPPLSETDITRERLALEEAIRKVETEAARQMRHVPAERSTNRAAPSPPSAGAEGAKPTEHDAAEPPLTEQSAVAPLVAPSGNEMRKPVRHWLDKRIAESKEAATGLSDVVADAESLGGAVAETGRSARETFSSLPSPSPEFERLEPRIEGEPKTSEPRARATERPRAPARASERPRVPERRAQPRADLGPDRDTDARYRSFSMPHSLEPPLMPESMRYVSERARRDQEVEERPLTRRMLGGLVKIAITVGLILLVAATAYWQRKNLASGVRHIYALTLGRGAGTAAPPRDTAQPRTKIPDRVGQQESSQPQQPEAAVAQRVVLYEEDPDDTAGKRFVGNAVWRTEDVSPAPGQRPDRGVRADISIPERNMQVTWSLRRNTDKDLSASHTISIQFNFPQGFVHKGIAEIRGVLMKQAEQTRGISLAGLSVKVTAKCDDPNAGKPGGCIALFLVALSSVDAETQRNIQLLKERSWFDIAVVYEDGRRAILAVEKGTPGERAFSDAFAAWGQ